MKTISTERIVWFFNPRAAFFRTLESPQSRSTGSYSFRIGDTPAFDSHYARPASSISLPKAQIAASTKPVIIVPLNFSGSWHTVAEAGISIAQSAMGRVVFCHAMFPVAVHPFDPVSPAWITDGLREEAREKMRPAIESAKKAGLVAAFSIEEGTPAEVILRVTRKCAAGLIVLAGRHQGAWARLIFGSTIAEQVTRAADCPVMIIRTDSTSARVQLKTL